MRRWFLLLSILLFGFSKSLLANTYTITNATIGGNAVFSSNLTVGNVLCEGDSITVDYTPWACPALSESLVCVGPYLTFGYPTGGFVGDTVQSVVSRIAADVTFLSISPKIVLLHIGTNNLSAGSDPTGIQNTVNLIQTGLLDAILSNDSTTKIYISTLIPRLDATIESPNNLLFNSDLVTMVQNYQATHATVHLVDMHARFLADATYSTDYYTDLVHPNTLGQQVMGNQFYKCVSNSSNQYCDGN